MDPQHTAVYATAHEDLRVLFQQIAHHGRVTYHELQQSLLPFTAGDAKRDLHELVDDMKRKQVSYDEPEFIRALWKKMYLTNVLYTTQHTSSEGVINIPFAHVIVSIKRRTQLKQFATYYTSRGISGAEQLSVTKDPHKIDQSTPRHVRQAQRKRQAVAAAVAQAATITALRSRVSTRQDVIVCCYDGQALCMKAHTMFSSVEMATVANVSCLYVIVSTKTTGTLLLGSRYMIERVRQRATRCAIEKTPSSPTDKKKSGLKYPIPSTIVNDLHLLPFDDLGLRNIVAFGVGRGLVVATTERRVHYWKAWDVTTASSDQEVDRIAYLEDEGDCFAHIPLLQRPKTVCDVGGLRQVACGDGFAMGVTTTAEVFTWGTAPLGRGKTSPTRFPVFMNLTTSLTVHYVACGLHHALVLASNGKVFAWGANVHGQLGINPNGSGLDAAVYEPTEVPIPSTVLEVACGDHHSIALTDHGLVYAWGNNWHGQLGMDPTLTESGCVFIPTKVSWWTPQPMDPESSSPSSPSRMSIPRVYLCTATGDTTAIVTEHGHVYMWGKFVPVDPFQGVCGVVAHWKPQRMDLLDDITNASETCESESFTSPWAAIAIANGLVLLTKHTTS